MSRIILGSNSPRRRELLAALDIDFTVDTGNDFKEGSSTFTTPSEYPALMSRGKSHGFHRPLEEDEILITSDTMVICGDKILGKPADRDEAAEMLRALSGREHEVITAVTMRSTQKELTFSDSTLVWFKELTEDEIDYYIEKYRPYDKAGAYGIQEWIGYIGITRIEGSFYNVMGFPVHRIWEELRAF
ncbi:MAG: septum formation protein Maf [Bacteroidales bacterium]|nr:septum formation protein Maf [Bacteroidales bacterium]